MPLFTRLFWALYCPVLRIVLFSFFTTDPVDCWKECPWNNRLSVEWAIKPCVCVFVALLLPVTSSQVVMDAWMVEIRRRQQLAMAKMHRTPVHVGLITGSLRWGSPLARCLLTVTVMDINHTALLGSILTSLITTRFIQTAIILSRSSDRYSMALWLSAGCSQFVVNWLLAFLLINC